MNYEFTFPSVSLYFTLADLLDKPSVSRANSYISYVLFTKENNPYSAKTVNTS